MPNNRTGHKSIVKYIPQILILFAVMIFGGLMGYFGRQISEITLTKTVSLDQVFNFALGIVVAILLQSVWQKNYGTTRVEKDLFLERLRTLQAKIDSSFDRFNKLYVDEKIDPNPRNRPEIRDEFNQLVSEIDAARRMVANLRNHLNDISMTNEVTANEIETTLIFYKQAITLKEYDEKWDTYEYLRSQKYYSTLSEKIFSLMIRVNLY